jgi:hypothetical protein
MFINGRYFEMNLVELFEVRRLFVKMSNILSGNKHFGQTSIP